MLDHVSWTTGREVRRVGLRAGRFVEAGPRAGKFVEACISWVHGQVLVWCAWNNRFRCIIRHRVLHDSWLVSLDVRGL